MNSPRRGILTPTNTERRPSLAKTVEDLAANLAEKESSETGWELFRSTDDSSEKNPEEENLKAIWKAACEISKKRVKAIEALIGSGFTTAKKSQKLMMLRDFFEKLRTENCEENPFQIKDEDGDLTPIWTEFTEVINGLKSELARLESWETTEKARATLTEDTLNPLGLDGESTSSPPKAISTQLPAGVADTTSIITAAPTPAKATLSTLHQEAKNKFFAISREVGNIENAISKLGWWQLLLEKNRKEKVRLQAELEAKITEREAARQNVQKAKAAINSHTKTKSIVPVATFVTEVATQLPEQAPAPITLEKTEPTGELATMASDILQRIKEEKASDEAQIEDAKAQAEKDRKALEKARAQKVAKLAKAKADLAKMSGVTGFFRSMFNWGEKARLEAEVARLTQELAETNRQIGTIEAPIAKSPAKPENTPGFLEWVRASTAAKVSVALVAGSLIAGVFSMKNSANSSDSTPTPVASSMTPEPSQPNLPTEPAVPTTASDSEKTSFSPANGDTIWDAVQDAGLTGAELAQTTNDIVTKAYADNSSSLGEHLHSKADFHKVVKQMTAWGGYAKVLESAQGQTDIAGFLNAVEQAHGKKVAGLVEANIASTFDPMDAPVAPSMIKAALSAQGN